MLKEFSSVFIFVLMGCVLISFILALSFMVRIRKPNSKKQTTYECGVEPSGDAWIQFNMRYYVFALLFVVFDVETVFLYPWAVVYRRLGFYTFVEMLVFLAILIFGFIYAWRKGALKWE